MEPTEHDDDAMIRLGDIIEFTLKHGRTVVSSAIVGGLAVVAVVFVWGATFTSSALIIPDSGGSSASSIAGLAAQFGITVPGGNGTVSPQLFVNILRSPSLLRSVATAPYTSLGDTTLLAHLSVSGSTVQERADWAVKALQKRLTVDADPVTGAIAVSFWETSPELARELVVRALNTLDSISIAAQARQATSETAFFANRLHDARDSVAAAVARSTAFLAKNRAIDGSPSLQFQRDQLQQNVDAARALYQTLQQSYESARLQAARAVPAFIVLEQPSIPAIRDRRWTILKGLAGAIFAFAFATVVLLWRQWWSAYLVVHPEAAAQWRKLFSIRRRA